MKYISTRGHAATAPAQALVQGLATDGGLYVPEVLPSARDWIQTTGWSYERLAAEIIRLFFGWEEKSAIQLSHEAYHGTFERESVISLAALGDGVHAVELFHGRTLAFKDLALSLFPHLLVRAKQDLGQTLRTLILTATSGDTGKAAMAGFADVPGTEIMVFYPAHGVSPMQRAQMQTQTGENVHVVGIESNFDEAQQFVKRVFSSASMQEKARIAGVAFSSANSINIGRLIPQIVYYIRTYTELVRTAQMNEGETFDVVVPTGNFGNILAGYLAKRIGVPIRHLICASNENHILADFFATGVYDRRREFHVTHSPSMDILISSNLERFLYYAVNGDTERVVQLMNDLQDTGCMALTEKERQAMDHFIGGWLTDEETLHVIHDVYMQTKYLLDPHTAVAYGVTERLRVRGMIGDRPLAVMATAHPYKFPDTVAAALGIPLAHDPYHTLAVLEAQTGIVVPTALAELADKPIRFTEVVAKEDMDATVSAVLRQMKETK